MKPCSFYINYILLLISFFVILNFTHAQTGSSTYQLDIKRKKDIHLVNMYPLANGDNLITSYDIGDTIETKLRFVRVKPDGTISWSRTYMEPGYYQYYVVAAATNDNGFIAAARLDSSTKYSLGTVLFKCDSSGNILWTKKLITADHSPTAPGPIIQTKDRGYYFVVRGYGLSQLEKLDKNGNIIWVKSFDPLNSDYWYNLDKLAESADGGAMLTVSNIGCEAYCIWYSLFKFQKNGSPASVIYFDPDFYFGTTAYYLNEDSRGAIQMIAGGAILSLHNHGNFGYSYITIQPNATVAKASIIKYDLLSLQHFLSTSKIAISNKKIYSNVNGLQSYFNFNNDWSLNFASDNHVRVEKPYLHIERYDSLGRICTNFSAPVPDPTLIQKNAPIYRGTFKVIKNPAMLVSSSYLFSTTLQNYDSMLCDGAAPAVPMSKNMVAAKTPKQISGIVISPNPAKDYIRLEFYNDINTAAQIQIISVDGIVLKTYPSYFSAGITTKIYDINNLPKGVYFLKITVSAGIRSVKFIKE